MQLQVPHQDSSLDSREAPTNAHPDVSMHAHAGPVKIHWEAMLHSQPCP